jgi:oligopeptidase A
MLKKLIKTSFFHRRSSLHLLLMSTTSANPLLSHEFTPRFNAIQSSHVKHSVDILLSNLEADLHKLEESLATNNNPGYSDVVEAVETITSPIDYTWGVVGHLNGVMNSDELREVHQECQPLVVKATTRVGQSDIIYKALQHIKTQQVDQAGESCSLDEAQRRALNGSLTSMKLSGVGLEGDDKDTFNKNKIRLSELGTSFSNNVLDATKAFTYICTDKEDVSGLPASALELASTRYNAHVEKTNKENEGNAAAEQLVAGTSEEGPWLLGLDMPSYLPSMKHLKSSKIRETLYRAYVSRAGENEENISEILKLKYQQAKLLGFNTPAEQSMERKMATVPEVMVLLEKLAKISKPAAEEELATLTAFAKENGFEGTQLSLWDVPFWSERMSEKTFGFTDEELRPYFALPSVLNGLFGVLNKLFGIVIKEAVEPEDKVETWHEDVRFFKIYDEETDKHIASFFMDLYSRPAVKRGGAWMNDCLGKSSVVANRDIPVAYLICNGTPPLNGKPSLMTFGEVTTLFHETGHGLQHMLTTVKHAPVAGISGVEWDAVELPSQFMENWCYDENTVYGQGLAVHFETGEPLPRNIFNMLKQKQQYLAGMAMLRQLYFGVMDMELHHNFDPNGTVKPSDVQAKIAESYTVTPPLKEDKFLCSFSHIFAGGYSAGYYSYKWAEVLSADAFAAFEEAGIENDDNVRAIGRKFRSTVLACGGGRHPSDVYRDFRGKNATPDALLRHSGLLK